MFELRVPAAKFARIGDRVAGRIIDARRTQHTEYKTNLPYYWEKLGAKATIVTHPINPLTGQLNDPKLQWELTLETGTPDENGITERRIFIRGKRMEQALRDAVQKTGARDGLLIGGTLTCTWSGSEPSAGGSDAKLYEFTYTPPAAGEGRRPDSTPHLAGVAEAFHAAAVATTAPTPEYALRQPAATPPPAAPIVTPYADTKPAAAQPARAPWDSDPPF